MTTRTTPASRAGAVWVCRVSKPQQVSRVVMRLWQGQACVLHIGGVGLEAVASRGVPLSTDCRLRCNTFV